MWRRSDEPPRAAPPRCPRRRPRSPRRASRDDSFGSGTYRNVFVEGDRCEDVVAVRVLRIDEFALLTHALDDLVLLRPLAVKLTRRVPGLGQDLGGADIQIVGEGIRVQEVQMLDDMHVAVVRDADRLVDREI